MPAPALTRPQVFTAADKISASGQQPTVANVRAQLGSGSYTTITAYLREWRESTTTPDSTPLEVPEAVSQALGRAAELVWQAATDHFRTELATLQKESARTVAECTQTLAEAQAEIEDLERMNASYSLEATKLRADLADCHHQIIALDKNQATLTAQLKAANDRIAEQALLLLRLTDRTDDLTDASTPQAPSPHKRPARTTRKPTADIEPPPEA